MAAAIIQNVSCAAFEDAMEKGNVTTIAKYFAQPTVRAEVELVDAFIITHAPNSPILKLPPDDEWMYPWYYSQDDDHRAFLFEQAIENDHLEIIEWFYSSPARVAWMGATLKLLLPSLCRYAVRCDQSEMLELLLTCEIFITHLSDVQRQDALNEAICDLWKGCCDDLLTILIAHGAQLPRGRWSDVVRSIGGYGSPHQVDLLIANGAFVIGANVLESASLKGNTKAARRLLEYGVDFGNATGEHLHAAAEWARPKLVQLYVEKGFADLDFCTQEGESALMMASWKNLGEQRHQVAQILLDHGADLRVKDSQGKTALHHAVENEQLAIASLLLENGADPNAKMDSGDTPLALLDYSSLEITLTVDMLDLLLLHGADPFVRIGSYASLEDRLLVSDSGAGFVRARCQYFQRQNVV